MVTRSDFNKYILPVYNPAKFIPKKAKGSYVWDQNNNKYLDIILNTGLILEFQEVNSKITNTIKKWI